VTSTAPGQALPPIVVDTDVLSFWLRDDTRGHRYSRALVGRTLVLSFQTVAELLRWSYERDWGGSRRAALERYLARFVVYPYTFELAREWARLTSDAARRGRSLASGDAWIAATATLNGLALATHNRRDFINATGLRLVSFAPGP
jgi:predicted nucleic acid-binding protein